MPSYLKPLFFCLLKATYKRYSYLSKHCAAVLPMIGAIVRHCVGINLAMCNNFSSSSRLHSVFLMLGSNHSNHLALHCLADLRCNKEAILDHWFFPYFITAAFNISSYKQPLRTHSLVNYLTLLTIPMNELTSVFLHTPPLIITRGILYTIHPWRMDTLLSPQQTIQTINSF